MDQKPAPLDWNPEEIHRQKTSPPASLPTWAKESFLTQETESYKNPSLLNYAQLIKKNNAFYRLKYHHLGDMFRERGLSMLADSMPNGHANLLCVSDEDPQSKVHARSEGWSLLKTPRELCLCLVLFTTTGPRLCMLNFLVFRLFLAAFPLPLPASTWSLPLIKINISFFWNVPHSGYISNRSNHSLTHTSELCVCLS